MYRRPFSFLCLAAALAWAQPQPPRSPVPPQQRLAQDVMERLGLSPDQRRRIETIRQDHRLKQIDLRASAEKARVTLEPLVGAEQPDEGRILSQMDRVSQAENELRKDEMRQQLEIRKVLTPDQWRRLQDERRNQPQPAPAFTPGPGQPKGRGQPKGPQGPPPQN